MKRYAFIAEDGVEIILSEISEERAWELLSLITGSAKNFKLKRVYDEELLPPWDQPIPNQN